MEDGFDYYDDVANNPRPHAAINYNGYGQDAYRAIDLLSNDHTTNAPQDPTVHRMVASNAKPGKMSLKADFAHRIGDKVYFVLNRHINPTNICVLRSDMQCIAMV